MTSVFLSCYNLPVIKQVAQVLGWIMNGLYKLLTALSIESYRIILCIVLFTVIIKLILLPMTIKQQKFTKLSAVMNPEIQAIQKKYQNKRGDQAAMMKMNQEMTAVYEKYGTSPTGGCLTLLIQMPILFALYGVISQMPTFIDEIGDYFSEAGKSAYYYAEEYDELNTLAEISDIENEKLNEFIEVYEDNEGNLEVSAQGINVSTKAIFDMIYDANDNVEGIVEELAAFDEEKWEKLLADNEKKSDIIEKYSKYEKADWDEFLANVEDAENAVEEIEVDVDKDYKFFSLNLGEAPASAGGVWAIIIPVLAALTQFLSVKVSNKVSGNASNMNENPMGASVKMMTYTMPIMSAVLCYTMPSGLGVYWIFGAVVTTIQTVFIAKYFGKLEVNDIIKDNIEKVNKKREKQGLPPKKITNTATTNVKNIKAPEKEVNENTEPKSNTNSTSNKGGIAAKAKLANKYNEKK